MSATVPIDKLGKKPEWILCPFCSTHAMTVLEKVEPIGEYVHCYADKRMNANSK